MSKRRKWFMFRFSLRTLAVVIAVFAAILAGVVQFKQFQQKRKAELRTLDKKLSGQGHSIESIFFFFGQQVQFEAGTPLWVYSLLDSLSVRDIWGVWYKKSLSNVEPDVLARIAKSTRYVFLKEFESLDDDIVKQAIGPRTTHLTMTQSRCGEGLFRDLELYAHIKELRVGNAVLPADRLQQIAKLPQLEELAFCAHRDSLAKIPPLQCRDQLKRLYIIVYPDEIESDDNDELSLGFGSLLSNYVELAPPSPTKAKHLPFLAGCEHLESLTFNGPLCTSTIQFIVAQCPRLKEVNIGTSIIELEGIQSLLSLPDLEQLRFGSCHLTDDALNAALLVPTKIASPRSDWERDYIERDEDSFFPLREGVPPRERCDARATHPETPD